MDDVTGGEHGMDSTELRGRTGVGDRQRRRILRFVKEFGQREGYSPSYREIAEELGLAVSRVSYHVSVLKQDGSLRRGPGQPRTIVEPASPATQAEGDEVEVPLIGQIAAGVPPGRRRTGRGDLPAVPAAGRPRDAVHAPGQGGLDDRGGDHRW
jgi:SOS-response transcriptional repressor LexA